MTNLAINANNYDRHAIYYDEHTCPVELLYLLFSKINIYYSTVYLGYPGRIHNHFKPTLLRDTHIIALISSILIAEGILMNVLHL